MSDIQTAPLPQNGEGWVVMYHPDLDRDGQHSYAEVTLESFEANHKAKGWKRANAREDLSGLLKDDLVELAEARGVDASGTKDDLLDRLAPAPEDGADDEGGDS